METTLKDGEKKQENKKDRKDKKTEKEEEDKKDCKDKNTEKET